MNPPATRMRRRCGWQSCPLGVNKTIPISSMRRKWIALLTQLAQIPESSVAFICTESCKEGFRISFHLFPVIYKCKRRKIPLCWKRGHVHPRQTTVCVRPIFRCGYISFCSLFVLFAHELLTIFLKDVKDTDRLSNQVRFFMTPGHIPLRVVCSRKFFEIAPFLKTLCSSFRLKVTCLHTNAGDKVCRLTFVKTRRDGIGVRERSVACTNGKSLRAKVVARRKLAYLLRILHRHIVLIVPNFGEKYSRIISM